MKFTSLFARCWVALAVLAAGAVLSGCATSRTPVQARLRPAEQLEGLQPCCEWARALDETQAAAAASWRL